MFFELLAAVSAAIGGAILAYIAMRWSGGRLTKAVIPVVAGLSMLAYTIWSEQTWFSRLAVQLPPDFVITFTNETTAWWRPWTYAIPMVNRFAAIDTGTAKRNDNVPDLVIADNYFWARWQPLRKVGVVYDCAALKSAPLAEDITFNPDGSIAGVQWSDVPSDDIALRAVCPEPVNAE